MKARWISSSLLAFILLFALSAASLEGDKYGALRLQEETTYPLREVLSAILEETGIRLKWLIKAAERFPEEPLFTQALEMEQTRIPVMLNQFAAWGLEEELPEPPYPPENPEGYEQALKALRGMAQRGMLMCMRLEVNGGLPDRGKYWAHSWGHEYRQQLDDCDLKAEMLGYSWAWQYEEDESRQQ